MYCSWIGMIIIHVPYMYIILFTHENYRAWADFLSVYRMCIPFCVALSIIIRVIIDEVSFLNTLIGFMKLPPRICCVYISEMTKINQLQVYYKM